MRQPEPYLLTPVGHPNRQARYILGPPLGPSYQDLQRQLEQARERLDNESADPGEPVVDAPRQHADIIERRQAAGRSGR